MSNPYQPPSNQPQYPQYPQHPGQGDATGGVIPYKNPCALIAYYLGILSCLLCFFGIPLGIVPVVLGIIGLQKRAANPAVKGTVHAWIGIVLGAISTLGTVFIIIAIISAIASKR